MGSVPWTLAVTRALGGTCRVFERAVRGAPGGGGAERGLEGILGPRQPQARRGGHAPRTYLTFLPSLLGSWPPGRRGGSRLEYLRFLGRPGPRRAGLRELSSLLEAAEVRSEAGAHPDPPAGSSRGHWALGGLRLGSSALMRGLVSLLGRTPHPSSPCVRGHPRPRTPDPNLQPSLAPTGGSLTWRQRPYRLPRRLNHGRLPRPWREHRPPCRRPGRTRGHACAAGAPAPAASPCSVAAAPPAARASPPPACPAGRWRPSVGKPGGRGHRSP